MSGDGLWDGGVRYFDPRNIAVVNETVNDEDGESVGIEIWIADRAQVTGINHCVLR